MKAFLSVTALVALLFSRSIASADDVDHFRKFKVPADEARILALTGVREFRCDYEVTPRDAMQDSPNQYQQDFELFAELYVHGKCTHRYRLARSVNAFQDPQLPLHGIFSFGWNEEKRQLVSVIDNQQFYSPWSASISPDHFDYFDYCFFEDSHAESRPNPYDSGHNFIIYPVVGICGDRNLQLNYQGVTDAASFLQDCEHSGAKNALVVYVYQGIGSVPLKFDSSMFFRGTWSSLSLGVVAVVVLIGLLACWLIRPLIRMAQKGL